MPEERVPKSSPSNGSVSLTQVTGAPMHYVNRTHCPVINYRCKVEFPQSTDTDNQNIYHLIMYSGAINITVVGKFTSLNTGTYIMPVHKFTSQVTSV